MKINHCHQNQLNLKINQLQICELIESNSQEYIQGRNQKNIEEKTNLPDDIESGYWRTNIMLSDSPLHPEQRQLTLKHLTSFEEKGMEDHGKKLVQSFKKYLTVNKKQSDPEQQFRSAANYNISSWEQIEQALVLISKLGQQKTNNIISFSKTNPQAQVILKQLLAQIPPTELPQALSILSELFKVYIKQKLLTMDQDLIQVFVDINYSQICQQVKHELLPSDFSPKSLQQDHYFEEMIGIWMENIFLSLNGVFQKQSSRKIPIQEFQGFQTFQTAKKLIKID